MCLHDKCRWTAISIWIVLTSLIKCSGDGGCGALLPRGEMSRHQWFDCLQTCPNAMLQADGNELEMEKCNVRLSRFDLVNHLENDCKLRVVHCLVKCYGRPHLEACPHAPVSCPLHCGAPNLTRQSLGEHQTDCPNEPVPCVHAHLRCSYCTLHHVIR